MTQVKIDTRRIHDWNSFHDLFSKAFEFPEFYGRNMNAWIDCMTYLDDPTAGMTKVHLSHEGVIALVLEHAEDFAKRCPAQYSAIIECAAFVNWRRIEQGNFPVLALAFYK